MKVNEVDSEDILYEMSNFNARTTGLPSSIDIWARTDLQNHGHSRYRVKITKQQAWAAIFTVGSSPGLVKDINQSLLPKEVAQIQEWIRQFYPLIISLIDGKIDSAEFAIEMQKIRNSG